MMKKYYGKKDWPETLYKERVDEDEIEFRKEFPDFARTNRATLPGDTEFYVLNPPFGEYDKNSKEMNFNAHLGNDFEDTNVFIEDTEVFQWFYRNRI